MKINDQGGQRKPINALSEVKMGLPIAAVISAVMVPLAAEIIIYFASRKWAVRKLTPPQLGPGSAALCKRATQVG